MDLRRLAATSAWILLCGQLMAADNWTEFRGPNGDGNAGSAKLPVEFSEEKNVAWKIPIPGKGWSSPVVWGNQLWLTTGSEDGKKLYGICVDRRSGKLIHNLLLFQPKEPGPCHITNSYASSTPAIEEGRVYLHFGSNGTACIDTATGSVLWKQEVLECNHWRGAGSSPVLYGDKILVAFDGYDKQYVAALDKATGKVVWKTDREIDYGTDNGDRKKAYSTGLIVKKGGVAQFVSPSAVDTISYDIKSGRELWRIRHGGMNAAARPLFGHGLIYIAAGSGNRSLIALRPDAKGQVSAKSLAWSTGKSVPRRPSQLLLEDHLFMVNDDGVASCLDAKTGEVVWRDRVGGNYRASLLHANGRIYAFDLEGKVTVFKASTKKLEIIGRNKLDHGFQASPAVAGNSLYLRTIKHLYCVEEK